MILTKVKDQSVINVDHQTYSVEGIGHEQDGDIYLDPQRIPGSASASLFDVMGTGSSEVRVIVA